MDERHQRNIEHFQQAMAAIGRDAVERARVPGTDDQVYCRCHERACCTTWIGPASAWSSGFGFSSPGDQQFMVRLCAEHDTPERRAEIDAEFQANLRWRADAWDRLWTKLLTQQPPAQSNTVDVTDRDPD